MADAPAPRPPLRDRLETLRDGLLRRLDEVRVCYGSVIVSGSVTIADL